MSQTASTLYFHLTSTTAPSGLTLPSGALSTWTSTTGSNVGASAGDLSFVPMTTSGAAVSLAGAAQSVSGNTSLVAQMVSCPLDTQAQIAAANWTVGFAITSTATTSHLGVASAFLVNGSTGAIRTTIFGGATPATIGATGKTVTAGRTCWSNTVAGAAFTPQQGDYIVVEIGVKANAAGAQTMSLQTSSFTAVVADNASNTTPQSFVTCPTPLIFSGQYLFYMSGSTSAPSTDTNPPTGKVGIVWGTGTWIAAKAAVLNPLSVNGTAVSVSTAASTTVFISQFITEPLLAATNFSPVAPVYQVGYGITASTVSASYNGEISVILVNGATGAARSHFLTVQSFAAARSNASERTIYGIITGSSSGAITAGDYFVFEIGVNNGVGATATFTLNTDGVTAITTDNVATASAKAFVACQYAAQLSSIIVTPSATRSSTSVATVTAQLITKIVPSVTLSSISNAYLNGNLTQGIILDSDWDHPVFQKPPLGAQLDKGHPLHRDTLVYYPLNNGTGFPTDIGPRKLDISINTMPTWSNKSRFGPGVVISGTVTNGSVATLPLSNNYTKTVAIWGTFTIGGGAATIGNGAVFRLSSENGYFIGINNSNVISAWYTDSVNAQQYCVGANNTWVSGVLIHIVATYNIDTGTVQLYLNGILSKTQSGLSTGHPGHTSVSAAFNASFNGATGVIYQAAAYNKVLSANEISLLYKEPFTQVAPFFSQRIFGLVSFVNQRAIIPNTASSISAATLTADIQHIPIRPNLVSSTSYAYLAPTAILLLNHPQYLKPPLGAQLNKEHPLYSYTDAYYLFNESAASSASIIPALDLSPNQSHINSGQLSWLGAHTTFGSGMKFSTTTIGTKNITSSNYTKTISFWAMISGINSGPAFVLWYDNHYSFDMLTGNAVGAHYNNSGGTAQSFIGAGGSLPLNKLTHFAATFDQTKGIINVYINGNLLGTQTGLSTSVPAHAASVVGFPGVSPSPTGQIYQAAVYNKVLSANEVLELYQEPFSQVLSSINQRILPSFNLTNRTAIIPTVIPASTRNTSYVGSFTTPSSTGNFSVTGVGFKPKAILFWGNPATADGNLTGVTAFTFFIGSATSSSNRFAIAMNNDGTWGTEQVNDSCIFLLNSGNGLINQADFVSMDSDGFTTNFSAVSGGGIVGSIVNFMAFGGDNLSGAIIKQIQIPATFPITQAYTGVGFKPDAIMTFTVGNASGPPSLFSFSNTIGIGAATGPNNRWTTSNDSNGGPAEEYQRTNAVISLVDSNSKSIEADLVSLDSDGFTLNYSTISGTDNSYVWVLCLKGGNFKAGSFTQPISTGNLSVGGLGFSPVGELFASFMMPPSTSIRFDGGGSGDDGERLMFGAMSSAAQRAVTAYQVYTVGAQRLVSLNRTASINTFGVGSGTAKSTADFSSHNNNDFTLNFSAADSTAREILYLAYGQNVDATSISAASLTANLIIPQIPIVPSSIPSSTSVATLSANSNVTIIPSIPVSVSAATLAANTIVVIVPSPPHFNPQSQSAASLTATSNTLVIVPSTTLSSISNANIPFNNFIPLSVYYPKYRKPPLGAQLDREHSLYRNTEVYYILNNNTNGWPTDSGPRQINLTNVNLGFIPTWSGSSTLGPGLSLPGASGQFFHSGSSLPASNNYTKTISLWGSFTVGGGTATSGNGLVFELSSENGYYVGINTSNVVSAWYNNATNVKQYAISASSTWTSGVLIHIVATFNINTGVVDLYINGNLSVHQTGRSTTLPAHTAVSALIGASFSSPTGILYQASAYNKILSASEIFELYQEPFGQVQPFLSQEIFASANNLVSRIAIIPSSILSTTSVASLTATTNEIGIIPSATLTIVSASSLIATITRIAVIPSSTPSTTSAATLSANTLVTIVPSSILSSTSVATLLATDEERIIPSATPSSISVATVTTTNLITIITNTLSSTSSTTLSVVFEAPIIASIPSSTSIATLAAISEADIVPSSTPSSTSNTNLGANTLATIVTNILSSTSLATLSAALEAIIISSIVSSTSSATVTTTIEVVIVPATISSVSNATLNVSALVVIIPSTATSTSAATVNSIIEAGIVPSSTPSSTSAAALTNTTFVLIIPNIASSSSAASMTALIGAVTVVPTSIPTSTSVATISATIDHIAIIPSISRTSVSATSLTATILEVISPEIVQSITGSSSSLYAALNGTCSAVSNAVASIISVQLLSSATVTSTSSSSASIEALLTHSVSATSSATATLFIKAQLQGTISSTTSATAILVSIIQSSTVSSIASTTGTTLDSALNGSCSATTGSSASIISVITQKILNSVTNANAVLKDNLQTATISSVSSSISGNIYTSSNITVRSISTAIANLDSLLYNVILKTSTSSTASIGTNLGASTLSSSTNATATISNTLGNYAVESTTSTNSGPLTATLILTSVTFSSTTGAVASATAATFPSITVSSLSNTFATLVYFVYPTPVWKDKNVTIDVVTKEDKETIVVHFVNKEQDITVSSSDKDDQETIVIVSGSSETIPIKTKQ